MKRAFFILLCGIWSVQASPQIITISGKVINAEGAHLKGVAVSLAKAPAIVDTTDSSGYFIIQTTTELYLREELSDKKMIRNSIPAERVIVPVDTLIAKKDGFADKKTPIESYVVSNITILMDSAKVRTLQTNSPQVTPSAFTLKGKNVVFYHTLERIDGKVDIFSGNGRKMATMSFANLEPGTQSVTLPAFSPGLHIARVTVKNTTYTCSIIRFGNEK